MSIKRSRSVSSNRGRDAGRGGHSEVGRDKPKPIRTYSWDGDVASREDAAFVAYAPTCKFEPQALIFHAKFGKGLVTAAQGTKIDVLFQDGPKMLVQNPAGAPPEPARVPPPEPATS